MSTVQVTAEKSYLNRPKAIGIKGRIQAASATV